MTRDANSVWAQTLVDELARAGVREVCIAPGSRSTPLVLAVAVDERFRTFVHLDERSAAFFALGVGKATGRPAAVVTTSGTAVANLLPAVVEARQSGTPLILLTADRPPRLRGTDANQTIDQLEIFGRYPRAFIDLELPRVEAEALEELRGEVCRAVATARGLPAGPVHVNAPFDKPLEPDPDSGDTPSAFDEEHPLAWGGKEAGVPFGAVGPVSPEPDAAAIAELARILERAGESSGRGLIVAGPVPDPWRAGPALRSFARSVGCPLLADPLSGGRYGPSDGATVLGAYDLFLRQEALWPRLAPDWVIRVGRAPTSAALGAFLAWAAEGRSDVSMGAGGPPNQNVAVPPGPGNDRSGRGALPAVAVIRVDPAADWTDHLGLTTHHVRADVTAVLEALAGELAGGERREPQARNHQWVQVWAAAEETARSVAAREMESGFFEGAVLAECAAVAGPGASFFVGSSMPVRDMDAFAWPREEPLTVLGNRGASGIDGSVSTALGAAAGLGETRSESPEPLVAAMGDVAFFHDANGLLAAREVHAPVVLVVIHNDGGGIFHMLPVRDHEPAFTRHFATPHGLNFQHIADLHGIPFIRVGGGEEERLPTTEEVRRALRSSVEDARTEGGTRIVEIASEREANRQRHEEVVDAVRKALAQVAEPPP